MRRLLPVLLALALCASGAQATNSVFGCPLVIDDFTQGALNVTNGPFEFTHVGLPAANCLGGTRHVVIDATPTTMGGMVLLSGGDIGYHMETTLDGTGENVFEPDVLLDYPMAQPTDITAGGLNDRIVIDVVSETDAYIMLLVQAGSKGAGKGMQLQAGSNTWFLSSFAPFLDLTQVTSIELYISESSVSNISDLTMSRVRVLGSGGRYLFLDLPTWIEIGPPFPLPGPLMEAHYVNERGATVGAMGMVMELQEAVELGSGASYPTRISSILSEGSQTAGFEFVEAAATKADHQDGHFSFRFVMDSIGPSLPISTRILDPTGVVVDPKSFTMSFEVQMGDGGGGVVESNVMRMRVQIPEGAAFRFSNVQLQDLDALSFGCDFDILDDGSGSGKAPGQELFGIYFDGDNFPTPVSTPAPLPYRDGWKLAAAPSIFSGRTVLKWERPVDVASSLRIFDLAGRLVRSLPVAAGQQSIAWDARDGRGQTVASGNYLAQLESGGHRAVQKLVVVR